MSKETVKSAPFHEERNYDKLYTPTLVLGIIVVLISCVLILMTELVIPDTSGVLTTKMQEACTAIMGEGNFEIVADWKAAGYSIDKPDVVQSLVRKDGSDDLAFHVVTDGYSAGGIDVLVVIDGSGLVKGTAFVANGDTPGIGSRADNAAFLAQFNGMSRKSVIAHKAITGSTPKAGTDFQALTGATYTSKGVAKAVGIAASVYGSMVSPEGEAYD